MRRAREAILAHGGAARCNVFTRILLALRERGIAATRQLAKRPADRYPTSAAFVEALERALEPAAASATPVAVTSGSAGVGSGSARMSYHHVPDAGSTRTSSPGHSGRPTCWSGGRRWRARRKAWG